MTFLWFTVPGSVSLRVSEITTSSVTVSWKETNYLFYQVRWKNGEDIKNKNETTNITKIENLTPGVGYTIQVTAIASDGVTEGVPANETVYTRPVKPANLNVASRSTDNLNITWTLPQGRVDHYVVNISNTKMSYSSFIETTTTVNFSGLLPGRDFNITVTAVAGTFTNTSDQVSFATYPMPVMSLIISNRTNSSLQLQWSIPEKMDGAPNISYNITYKPSDDNVTYKCSMENNIELDVPNPVQNATASPVSTNSIMVIWSKPLDVQEYYWYLVQTYNNTRVLINTMNISSSKTSYEVPNLEPGFNYSIKITTIIASDTESTSVEVFSYTMPKAVTNLTVSFVNTTFIQLSWRKQTDYKPSYSYLVEALLGSKLVHNDSTTEETFLFNSLIPGTPYTFNVFTVQEGLNNSTGSMINYTVLSNKTTQYEFEYLKPGVLYLVTVVTKSGNKSSNSSVSNATFPNPPGSIMVDFQTNTSINFTWSLPADMDPQQYNFSVSTVNGSTSTQNNWFLLKNLESGCKYTVSVVTVGVLGYESSPATTQNYTKPNLVTDLMATEITTSSVTLNWNKPNSKPPHIYEVRVESVVSNASKSELVNITTIRFDGLESGRKYNFTITTLTEDHIRAESVSVFYHTRPYNITDLNASALNTTAVYLNWIKPYEYKDDFRYWVETTGCSNQTNNSTVENVIFSELTPGTNCSFCVSVMAADGIKGKETCTYQYTKPEVVQLSISNKGSNDSVLVSWTKAAGNVEYYKLQLNSTSVGFLKELDFTTTFFLFGNLSAAGLYNAVLISYSGPFCEPSEMVTNATYPNPPGPIDILKKTTSSIELSWEEAPLMEYSSSYNYRLTYNTSQQDVNVASSKTNYTLALLLSGTSYNISVKTVGPMNFESESVYKYRVTTRPHNVTSLNTIPTENSINVSWNQPVEYKSTYSFLVAWQNANGSNTQNHTSHATAYEITQLLPGTEYIIKVTTETSDGTQSATETVSNCTNASPVVGLDCNGPNHGNAEIILEWTMPNGNNTGFQITVYNSSQSITSNGNCCKHTISNLAYHSEYEVKVETQSCGKPSTPVQITCQTGISNPPIPLNYNHLIMTKKQTHKTFMVQIQSDLIINSRGPVTHVGILVTSDDKANISNPEQYLKKTYNEWRLKTAQAYLATVRNYTQMSRSSSDTLEIEIGTGSEWEGYANNALDPTGTYKYAIVIFTSLSLDSGKINTANSLFSITNFLATVVLSKDPAFTSIAIGVTLGIFGVLFVILIGFVIYWRRLYHKESPDIQIQSLGSVAVRVEDFESYYRKQKADSSCGFAEEFEDLKPVGTAQAKLHALALENKPKNRYNNVLPYDSSRVKLSVVHGSPNEDYINANYMPGYLSRKEFIAAQGPLPATVNEFWRMVWEKNVQTLVMLTRCNEQGRVKCEQYWGPGTKCYEDIIVTTTSEIPLEDWTIRDFDIKNVKTTEVRSVRQFHFTAWPDHGVPETTELLISFRHLVREHMNQYSRNSPTVVHCSAGVGRTGTFIAIDRLIFQIERENIVDVYGIVHDLRMHRPLMVQTEDQYVFLNQCALDIIRARTGNNVDLIYQNTAAISIYENVEPKMKYSKTGY
ncbi:receptor-type tyrosine-protein phosphatase eta [Anableps anableps]